LEDWTYEPAPDLDASYVERLRRFPRQPDMLTYGLRACAALSVRAWLRTYHRLRVEGRENLPKDGSFVLVANHASHLDALTLLAALPMGKLHRAFPAAARDYFFTHVPRVALAAIVINALPFDRAVHIRHSLKLCRALLENPGNVLILFPEGTRSATGQLGEFKPGIGWLLAGSTVPVLPCYIDGAFAAWRKGTWLPRPARLCVRIGPPQVFADAGGGRDAVERIVSTLRDAVERLA